MVYTENTRENIEADFKYWILDTVQLDTQLFEVIAAF